MSEIVQLYKDEEKTIKVYPKTLASEVYVDENTNIISQLEQKAQKVETQNIQRQINNLVLGAVGSGNNAEVVQARGNYTLLNERLMAVDNFNNKIEQSILYINNYKNIFKPTDIVSERIVNNTTTKYIEINNTYTTQGSKIIQLELPIDYKKLDSIKISGEIQNLRGFIGIGTSNIWTDMFIKDYVTGGKFEDTFNISSLTNIIDGYSTIRICVGCKSNTEVKMKLRFEYQVKKDMSFKSDYSIESQSSIESQISIVTNNAGGKFIPIENILKNRIGMYINNKVNKFNLTKGTGTIINEKYVAYYIRIDYDNINDLNKLFNLNFEYIKGSKPTNFCIVKNIADANDTNFVIDINVSNLNNDLNLYELITSNGSNYVTTYSSVKSLYIYLGLYSETINNAEFEWNIRPILFGDCYVYATDVTPKLKQDIIDNVIRENYITCWGDSLTYLGGWTTRLQELTGVPVYNGGTGGETSYTIMARQGADAIMVNNITIPADTSTSIILANKGIDTGLNTFFGRKVTPLMQRTNHFNPCFLGDIEGELTFTGTDYTDTSGNWIFRRKYVGNSVVIDRPTAIRTNFDINRNKPRLMVIFMGENDSYVKDENEVKGLINRHKLMIKHSHCYDYIVLGLSNGTRDNRLIYETMMKEEFGRRFISLREYLNEYGLKDLGLEPTEEDKVRMESGQVPKTLLADNVHYTEPCKIVIGNMIYKRLKELNIF